MKPQIQATLLAGVIAVCPLFVPLAQGQSGDITGITSASTIDPSGGATITYQNPNWSTWFSAKNGDTWTAVKSTVIEDTPGVFILNFEAANGFGTAAQSLGTDGKVFSGTNTIAPFTTADEITSFTTSTGVHIGVQGVVGSLDSNNNFTLGSASGSVFLVGDRPANDTMVSGTQGLTVGPYNGNTGIYLTFDQNLSAFSCVVDTASASNTYYIVLFDSSGNVIATYGKAGIGAGSAMNFGVSSSAGDISSVWIGEMGVNYNGMVIDDVAFVTAAAIPEPAAFGALIGVMVFGVAVFWRRRRLSSVHVMGS